MTRLRYLLVCMLSLGALAWAAQVQPKAPPKGAHVLKGTELWYMLHVPDKYDVKEVYPMLVVVEYREDFADAAFAAWLEVAKLDRIFLASLNFPPGSKEDRVGRLWEMVLEVCKQYENIDRKKLMLLGVEGGAIQAMQFVASRPRVFADAIALAPRAFPDVSKVKPSGPALASSPTRILVTYDTGVDRSLPSKIIDANKQFAKLHLRLKPVKAQSQGSGVASDDEKKLALETVRDNYSESKRSALAPIWREVAEKARAAAEAKKKESEQKTAQALAELKGEGPKKRPDKQEELNADDLYKKARELDEAKNFAGALECYEKLAKLQPNSDYARVAEKRIKEINTDPSIKRAMADKAAGAQVKSLMNMARSYLRSKMPDKAAAEFKKIIARFPDTSYAEEARKELETLEGEQK